MKQIFSRGTWILPLLILMILLKYMPDLRWQKDGVDGTIISEVSNTTNGIKIKLADRMKSLAVACRSYGSCHREAESGGCTSES